MKMNDFIYTYGYLFMSIMERVRHVILLAGRSEGREFGDSSSLEFAAANSLEFY